MGRVVKRRDPHLRLAEGPKLPMTLDEYAGNTDVDAELRQKLGEHCFWLFASQMYGIYMPGDEEDIDYLNVMDETAVPVFYKGLRTLPLIKGADKLDCRLDTLPEPDEPVAIFKVNIFANLASEPVLSSGKFLNHYTEVAVRLTQKVTVLEFDEYQSNVIKPGPKKPHLHIIHDDPLDIVVES